MLGDDAVLEPIRGKRGRGVLAQVQEDVLGVRMGLKADR